MIPNNLFDAGLTPQAFMVWSVLRKHADNETGKAWPSRETIADHLGIKPKGVDRYVRELEDKGLVRVERRRPRPNVYWLETRGVSAETRGTVGGDSGESSEDVPNPSPMSPTEDIECPSETTLNVPHRRHELYPENYTHLTRPITSSRGSSPMTGTEDSDESGLPQASGVQIKIPDWLDVDDEEAVLDWVYEVAHGRGYVFDEEMVRGILNCPSYTRRGAIRVAVNKIIKDGY